MADVETKPRSSFLRSLAAYREPSVLFNVFFGFSCGLPFYLIFQTLSAWLRQDGILRSTIGMMSWVGLVYTIKFLWAPVVDRLRIPVLHAWLGRRRSWMLLAQIGIGLALLNLSLSHPAIDIRHVTIGALILALFAATQDIAMDAWRIESVPINLQGAAVAAYQTGYRVALITGGAGALGLAGQYSWHASYCVMAVLAIVGVVTTLLAKEPQATVSTTTLAQETRVIEWLERKAHWPPFLRAMGEHFIGAVVCPFVDFYRRFHVRVAIVLLLFMGLFRVPEFVVGSMANPFYIDHGYTLEQIGTFVKAIGLPVAIVAVFLAGVLVTRFGVRRILYLGCILMMIANIGFALLAKISEPTLIGLALVNSFDNLSYGVAGTALLAFLSSLTNPRYTATQYALFSSIYALPGKILDGFSGFIAEQFGYFVFFIYAASIATPALLLLFWLARQNAIPVLADRAKQ